MEVQNVILLLLLTINLAITQNTSREEAQELHVGVILDLGSIVGKMARTSVSLAMEDFYAVHRNYSTKLVLHIRDSMSDDVQAASQAIDLLENYNVEVIIGPQKSSQAIFISKLGNKSHAPVISFTATSPSLSSKTLPYFVRATINDSAQVNCIASIIKTYGWREVVPIYEDTDYGRGIIPYLVDVLQEVDARVPYQSVIPLSATSEQITLELYKLMTMQTTVFVVHMSFTLASLFFIKAREVGMMNKGYAWIMTDGVTNLIDSLNPSILESLNGAIGVEFYVPKTKELDDFAMRWNMRFQIDNPTDPPLKLNIFGLWGYDTIWAVAHAAAKVGLANATFQKPGESIEIPRGFKIPVSGKKLQVGVCTSGYPEFVKVEKDHITGATKAIGFSVDVFEEAVKRLPYAVPYEYVLFSTKDDGSAEDYNDFVYQVYLEKYDIVIGDITIRYNRTFYLCYIFQAEKVSKRSWGAQNERRCSPLPSLA
ncbi:glutamate receptor 2.8-like [Triticum dicoccoides]|uniref:glutamate receptor 2.8-like n=1 Tax=Triticum dicoccoides TaxID=85692 RepID=UPI00188EAC04|nr:glutamate receptor 2.8-like [Triticum dicoccoides]